MQFNSQERNTILAALRFYQQQGMGEPANRSDEIHAIATNGDEDISMDDKGIDALCERINFGGNKQPTAVIEVNGGVINCVRVSEPMRVVILDEDTEGGDPDNIHEIHGKEVYVHHYVLDAPSEPGFSGVDPEYVENTLSQLDGEERQSDGDFSQIPLNTDILFGDAPGETGGLWARVCEAENALAKKLRDLPEGTAVILADEVWFLAVKDGMRVLTHAQYKDGEITEASSRSDFDLMFVDVSDDDLREYAERVERATEQFEVAAVPIN